MGIFNKIHGEFIDIIQWLDDSQDTIVYRFERHNNEIKTGAQLTVRESQVAVLVNEGQMADVYQPGLHTLTTENMPILTTLKGWKYGFNSPFQVEVYFVNTKRFTDLKWGTANPIMVRDPDFGVVRVRAFGNYAMRVSDASLFLKELSGTDWQFTTDMVEPNIRNQIVTRFTETVAGSHIPVLDLASRYTELGEQIRQSIAPALQEMGIAILNFNIENVSVPPEVEEAIDKRSSIGVVGNLNSYTQYQAANAMEAAAQNPGGMGSAGVGIGLGAAMGQMIGQAAQPGPPPVPTSKAYHIAVGGQQAGPYSASDLQGMIGSGQVSRTTLVWTPGMPGWLAAEQVTDLAGLFASVPPPLPPA
jgi:membrane protease subunit (stomatin/prohibitin family)